jgi:hypothetical protein
MTQDEIIEMARQAGFDEHHAKFDTRIETFANLAAKHTLLNIDPSSFMSYQEGVEAGRFAEREAFKQIIRETPFSNWFQADLIEAIDKRGQA